MMMGDYEYIQKLNEQDVKKSAYVKIKRLLDIIGSLIFINPKYYSYNYFWYFN